MHIKASSNSHSATKSAYGFSDNLRKKTFPIFVMDNNYHNDLLALSYAQQRVYIVMVY